MPARAGEVRDADAISGLGKFPVDGNGNPLQYSCLENPMNSGAERAPGHGGRKELNMTQGLNNNNETELSLFLQVCQ